MGIENKEKKICAVVLAAGKGTRMKTDIPKVMCQIHSKPMLQWVIEALRGSGIRDICTVINDSMDYRMIKGIYKDVCVCYQHKQQGTADAVASCGVVLSGIKLPSYTESSPCKEDEGRIIDTNYLLICFGDTPGVNSNSIREFITRFLESGLSIGVIGMRPENPFGYGRLILDQDNNLTNIVEERDCSEEERKITICNSGVILVEKDFLFSCLQKIIPSNSQKEYYLTDCFKVAFSLKKKIFVYEARDYREFLGVNDQDQLLKMTDILKR